jgi:hypothetical protein
LNECSTTVARALNLRDHEDEVGPVLEQFFELVEGSGWVNRRADEEIAKYHNRLEAASRAGKASAERRSNARSTTVQPNNKQETVNIKQETKISTRDKPLSCPDGVSPEVWDGFTKVRKAKKAPVTQAAMAGIEREARKAGWSLNAALTECCARGWAGFKADWVNKDQNGNKTQHQINQEGIARSLGLLPKHDEYQGTIIEGEIYDAESNTAKRLG